MPLFSAGLECPESVSEAVGYDVMWETPTGRHATVTVTPTLQTSTVILEVTLAIPITETDNKQQGSES